MWLSTLLFVAFSASAEPVLAISGSCPGSATVAVAAMTPGGNFAIVKGDGLGSDAIPAGSCAGVETGLTGLSLITVRRDRDGDGVELLFPALPATVCSSVLQVIDIATCEVSEPFDMLGLVGTGGGITSFYLGVAAALRGGTLDTFDVVDARAPDVLKVWLPSMRFHMADLAGAVSRRVSSGFVAGRVKVSRSGRGAFLRRRMQPENSASSKGRGTGAPLIAVSSSPTRRVPACSQASRTPVTTTAPRPGASASWQPNVSPANARRSDRGPARAGGPRGSSRPTAPKPPCASTSTRRTSRRC